MRLSKTIAFHLSILSFLCGAWAQQPNNPTYKSVYSSPPEPAITETQPLQVIPVVIEKSINSQGESVEEFAGRKDVLKSMSSAKASSPFFSSIEVKLTDEILRKRPAHGLYFCVSVFPPSKGAANLVIRRKEETNLFLFRDDINKRDVARSAVVHRQDGWIDVRFPLAHLNKATDSIVLELTGDDPNSSAGSFVGWADCAVHLVSLVKHEALDPTKQTLFQNYTDRSYGQLIDVATGKVLKSEIGIGWISSKTTCVFSNDGSHVAVISKAHDHPRSGSTDYEHLWVFCIKPFGQVQEAESRRFRNVHFDQDNKTLLFQSDGGPEISGK